MAETLQPSNDERATLFAIAWDIVKVDIVRDDANYTSEQIASIVAHAVARMVKDPSPSLLDENRLASTNIDSAE